MGPVEGEAKTRASIPRKEKPGSLASRRVVRDFREWLDQKA
jgi:hypothetical protein